MAHDAHHDSPSNADKRPTKTPSSASFWFVIIMVGLFIAAVNFVSVMSHDDDGGGHGTDGHSMEHPAPAGAHDNDHHAPEMHDTENTHDSNHEAH